MATRIPLVMVDGQVQQLQAGDTVDSPISELVKFTMTNANAGALVCGTPVYVSSADHIDKGRADSISTSELIGLMLSASTASGGNGIVVCDGVLTLTTTEWNAIVGTAGLVTASVYYLDPTTAGKMTTTAPTTPGQWIVRVGYAISLTQMNIELQPPIQL